MKVERALKLIEAEAREAARNWPAFNSMHEGYAVLLEEVDELWDEVKKNPQNLLNVRFEVIQVGAMAVRFLADLSLEEAEGR